MKIVSCVGAKGGTGKSSLSLLLAWELSEKNKVAVLDADIQGTCLSAKALNKNLPFEVFSVLNKVSLWEVGKQLAKEGYDYLIIDGNPRSIHEDQELIEVIAKLSDLNLIISRPSPRDLKAQVKYADLVKKATKGAVRICWNFFQKATGVHQAGIPQGEDMLGIPSLATKVALRIVYQDISFTEGNISELNNKDAMKEIKSLVKEVKELLHGKQ